MKHHNIMPWARKLTVLSVLIALIATVYAFGAATPQETLASGHVEYVPLDWSLKPAGHRSWRTVPADLPLIHQAKRHVQQT